MHKYYSNERSVQILISLLKAHNIHKVVASPGTANQTFVGSIMYDDWFEIYSSVDERSAAYIACGLADESQEPVVLTCTGATASRNYLPALTEAYYRKLPILTITSTKDIANIGHLIAQVIDRSNCPNDTCLLSEHINAAHDAISEWDANIKINRAILELTHRGGGPVHINLTTTYNHKYTTKELPQERVIHRIESFDSLPELPKCKIGIFIGAHKRFSAEQTKAIENFCLAHNAVVFCDHTSGYHGKMRIQPALIKAQSNFDTQLCDVDLLIHIGEVSGDYQGMEIKCNTVWRVNPDGEIRDLWHKLSYVFEMPEQKFFEIYTPSNTQPSTAFYDSLKALYDSIILQIPQLPLSNTWIAQQTAHQIPANSTIHLGILNTLRNWNFFEFDNSINSACNTGGFGIDGILSTLLGASLNDTDKLNFVILGDLAFFYDMNALGNRHIGNNIRIMLINNGKGTEFRNYNNPAYIFGDDTDWFIAAGGHYGNKSPHLVKHYAEDLGFEYLSANDKDSFIKNLKHFVSPQPLGKPVLFEVFTDSSDESDALKIISNILTETSSVLKNNIVSTAKNILGEKSINTIKKFIKR